MESPLTDTEIIRYSIGKIRRVLFERCESEIKKLKIDNLYEELQNSWIVITSPSSSIFSETALLTQIINEENYILILLYNRYLNFVQILIWNKILASKYQALAHKIGTDIYKVTQYETN